MNTKQKYDIIIVGAGGAGLSLASTIALTKELSKKSVLLIDKSIKEGNDRTWCFWEKDNGAYDEILTQSWDNVYFHSKSISRRLNLAPYSYKMLRSGEFYRKTLAIIESAANVQFVQDEVFDIDAEKGLVSGANQNYSADLIFSSRMPAGITYDKHLYTDQHFGGWFVDFEEDVFDRHAATFMDFRIEQNKEHRFCYVLPMSSRRALVEVAVFSNNHLTQKGYDEILKKYIEKYVATSSYDVVEKEYGVIPMTNYPFWNHNHGKLYHIGTAGGAVKPSSGFAFRRMQQHTKRIVDCLVQEKAIDNSYKIFKGRHLLYDSIMLHVLEEQKIPGEKVFTDLFEKTDVDLILKFLDGDTSISGDLQIMKAPVKWPFIKGMAKVISKF